MKTPSKNPKTVYVLGAGFSSPAGGPDQAKLIERIFELPNKHEKVIGAKHNLEEFMLDVLRAKPGALKDVTLEEIYTPIDRCLADGVSLRGKDPADLRTLRGDMEYLISLAIDHAFEVKAISNPSAAEYTQDFADYLVATAAERAEKARDAIFADEAKAYDPFSIISLNWDISLDRAIYRSMESRDGPVLGDYEPHGVVDYCCHISSIDEYDRRIRPGLWALGSRGYNVKLLKLHGSMNWLQCSNCQRLFVGFDEKINIPNYIIAEECRHCSNRDVSAKLQGSLVMPTFLKDLSNFQLKLIWQNAATELMEADNIIFIGYSLPAADFEFRQLLSRMVHKDAEITAVLYHDGTPESKTKYDKECDRYQQFFGARTVHPDPDGVEAFVKRLRASKSL